MSTTHSPKRNPYVIPKFAFSLLSNFVPFIFFIFCSSVYRFTSSSLSSFFKPSFFIPSFFNSSTLHLFSSSSLQLFVSSSLHLTVSFFITSPLHLFIFSCLHLFISSYLLLHLFTSSFVHPFCYSTLFLSSMSFLHFLDSLIIPCLPPYYCSSLFSFDNLLFSHSYHFAYTERLDIRLSIFRRQVL